MEHTFSHLHWNLRVYDVRLVSGEVRESENVKWVAVSDLEPYAFPVAYGKVVKLLGGLL